MVKRNAEKAQTITSQPLPRGADAKRDRRLARKE
jgi:hypothetical protein